ncbi:hypothetical protein [Neolewinella antarctica]|uniref:Uncharacterized protein n=1 Tax=Neolewinella antarctica TaxID=442734 RepID=A0ABX0X744_9BACT|nr:hypothetical protein [Neolewinella antarctica]NJC24816.1 hypothetical protein [Neolewinella antarctica]
MNHFAGVTANEYWAEGKDKSKELIVELVLLFDAPDYALTNDGQIIRNRKLIESRFVVSKRNLDTLISSLVTISEQLPSFDKT